jgi:hypothetical protein
VGAPKAACARVITTPGLENSPATRVADSYDAPMATPRHPAVVRIAQHHGSDLVDVLSARLSGADLTALLLEVARRRSAAVTPADVLAQYERDRFVGPSGIDGRSLLDTEHRAVTSLNTSFDVVSLAPLAPLGAHSVVAGVSQNRVVATSRNTEVAADPTNGLALEASIRRRELLRSTPRSSASLKLAAVQRVTRAQHVDGPMSFAHFSLLGAVIAGRDIGDAGFERAALVEMLATLAVVVRALGADDVAMSIHDFDGRFESLIRHVRSHLEVLGVHTMIDPERTTGIGYYPSLCFKVLATFGTETIEVGDGGFVPWTQHLLSNAKERLLIGGLGLDRLALLRSSPNDLATHRQAVRQ